MPNARQKGLNFVHEVKRILEGMNHEVEGPGFASAYFNNRINPIHRDYFSVFDLISFDGDCFLFHQISTIKNKSAKVKAIQKKKMSGWVWCRFNESRKVGYRIFFVKPEAVTEGRIIFKS
jgi:hypothetical protein